MNKPGDDLVKLAVFASGNGSNLRKILESQSAKSSYKVALVLSNKRDSGAILYAHELGIPTLFVNNETLNAELELVQALEDHQIDIIILAGFMKLIPKFLIDRFKNRILNIHPSLLPKYGGKGMYGHFVHESVKLNNESKSGMTIHIVDEIYDQGRIIFQVSCRINPTMSSEEIGAKVLQLEHCFYPRVINGFAKTIAQKNIDI